MKKAFKESEIMEIAGNLAKDIQNGGILELIGDLGTGKTTLTKALTEVLGIQNFKIKSPTYSFIRHYPEMNFYHIDLYRIEDLDELLELEIQEIVDKPKNIVVIEWADRMSDFITQKRIKVFLKYIDPETREIEIKKEH